MFELVVGERHRIGQLVGHVRRIRMPRRRGDRPGAAGGRDRVTKPDPLAIQKQRGSHSPALRMHLRCGGSAADQLRIGPARHSEGRLPYQRFSGTWRPPVRFSPFES